MSEFRDYDDLTWFATILGAHGIKGAVRVKFFTETPEYYLSVKSFLIENEGKLRNLNISRILPSKDGWIIFLRKSIAGRMLKRKKVVDYYFLIIS